VASYFRLWQGLSLQYPVFCSFFHGKSDPGLHAFAGAVERMRIELNKLFLYEDIDPWI
jgi:hypothetical protein